MKLSISLLAILALCAVADANKDKADALFKQGKKLMADKRYADACEAFEKSYKLDPVIGTKLNVAKCYEDWGKIGRAFIAYQEAEKMAKDAKDPREPKIHEIVVGLGPSVPRLTIKLPKDAPPDLEVKLDTKKVTTFGEPLVIDPGPHTIEWKLGGSKQKKNKVVLVDRGGESEVSIDVPRPEASEDDAAASGDVVSGTEKPPEPAAEAPKSPDRTQHIAGLALGGAGVVALGVSSYMTLSARGKYNDALDMYCGGMANNCDPTGLEITRDARSTANKATIVFLAGAAMVGGGVALYLLAPKRPAAAPAERSVYVTPSIGPDGLGLVVGGSL